MKNPTRFGSNRPPSEQELQEAQNSLKLLKAKMRNTRESEFRRTEEESPYNNSPYEDVNRRAPPRSDYGMKNYQESPSSRNNFGGADNAYSRNNTGGSSAYDSASQQQQQNSNYRKIFLPQQEKNIDPKNMLFGEKTKVVYDSYSGYKYNDNYNSEPQQYDMPSKKKAAPQQNTKPNQQLQQQSQNTGRVPVNRKPPVKEEAEDETFGFNENYNPAKKPPARLLQNATKVQKPNTYEEEPKVQPKKAPVKQPVRSYQAEQEDDDEDGDGDSGYPSYNSKPAANKYSGAQQQAQVKRC